MEKRTILSGQFRVSESSLANERLDGYPLVSGVVALPTRHSPILLHEVPGEINSGSFAEQIMNQRAVCEYLVPCDQYSPFG